MKRKIILVGTFIILLGIFFTDIYLRIEYDMGAFSLLQKQNELTSEERTWLEDHGTIIYGADQNAPPLRYLDGNTMQFKGMVIDYLRALSIELGVEIEFKPLVWEEALIQLEQGQTDICDMYPSDKRAEVYLFTDGIYNQKSIILTGTNNSEITDYRDLNNRVVAAQKGDYAVEYLSARIENIQFVYTDDYMKSIDLLRDSKVDAVVGDEPVVNYFIEVMRIKDKYRIVEAPLFERESVLAIPKSEKILQSIMNKGIYNLKRKNTMEKIYQKWYGISAPFIKGNTTEKILLAIAVVGMILVLLTYIFFSWNKLLKDEVEKRTRELSISRKDLQTTFDSLMHLMVVLDSDRTIINANKSFCMLVGLSKEKILGRNYSEWAPFRNNDEVKEIIDGIFEDGNPRQEELNYKDKIFEVATYPMEENDKSSPRILVMAKDVTTVRISEMKLLQSNKIEAVGQLAAGVAHEIRNPLGVIRNYCYILKKDLSADKVKKDKAISTIETSVEKASNIIDNLLNFSRLSGEEIEKVFMKRFIEDILALEHKLMRRNNIDARLECDGKLVCFVNQESLKHVFINLISNAVDAMPDGGRLDILCSGEDGKLVVEFKDTGMGIGKEHIENIFDPFFTTKAPGKGTGLGLYLTYNEIEKLGGEINVESEINEGTKFTVMLPCKEGGDLS